MEEVTLEQACGLKLMVAFHGTEPSATFLRKLASRQIAGVTLFRALNVENPYQVRKLTATLQSAIRQAGLPPLLIGADQEGGQLLAIDGTTPFPGNMALAATGSVELARQTGYALGRELAAMGVNVNYAPVCDVNSNPRNPVIGVRSFGEDPIMVARFCAAMIEGIQAGGVAATAKHFPGHGDTNADSHAGMPVQQHTQERLEQIELPPFVAAVQAGVRLIMTAHIALPNLNDGALLPATLSPALLQRLLRQKIGFQGTIISDAMNMAAIQQGSGLIVDAIAAVTAGIDLVLCMDDADEVYTTLLLAAQRGLVSSAQMMLSAHRVLALKGWLAGQPQPGLEVVGCQEHQDLASQTAERAVTVVRNASNLLPLHISANARLAVVLPQPTDLTPADTSSYVTCGLADAMRRFHPLVDEFILPFSPSDTDVTDICQVLHDYDLAIVGTINACDQAGQAALVNTISRLGKPTVVVALRLPYDLAAYPDVSTFVCTYGILRPSMDALARALWGVIPWQGRLPVSIPGLYPVGHGIIS
jgi:beta-N-acetylhexosaminidase